MKTLAQKKILLILLSVICFISSFALAACSGDIQYLVAARVEGLGGTVSGGGIFVANSEVTVCATPSFGYEFVCWVNENGEELSTDAEYSFINTYGNYAVYARFSLLDKYNVNVVIDGSGTVDGGEGSFFPGETIYLYVVDGVLIKWEIDGIEVGTTDEYSFVMPAEDVTVTVYFLIG